jgi:ATP-dependent DNA helicase RecG
VIDRLTSERLVDQTGETYAVRRLGGLLLGKKLAEFPDLARKAPRVVVYSGKAKLETKLDQIGTVGYAVGFQRLVNFVMSQMSQNEAI